MLAYAGKGRFVIEAIDLTALVEELMPLLKVSVAHHGTLRLEVTRGLAAVSADATQLRQIVMNLVLNAADAIAGRSGEVVVSTGTMHASGDWLAGCVAGTGLPAGHYVYLEVRDNGVGMPPDVQARIFDPFFTTKFAGRGLGLAAVLGIVRGHHGALQVRSEPNRGTAFRLLLPPLPVPAAPMARPERARDNGWQHRGRVLVVEDEPPVRMVVAEILKSFGCTVTPVGGGTEALEVFARDGAPIDLVVLDILMPEMGGEEVLARLRAIRPDVRVLLMSGYTEGDLLGRLASPRGRLGFIAKPFTRSGLEAKLREILA
jgi:CheY-like chemotaxis protein/two-component sensor histidine kinase